MAMTYTIKLGSTDISSYLKEYDVERNKLWTDSDRNLDGTLKATFIGVFPKISLGFTYLTEAQLKTLTGLLEPSVISVVWWDSKSGGYKTSNFYAGDYKFPMYDKGRGLYEPFGVNLISYSKYV